MKNLLGRILAVATLATLATFGGAITASAVDITIMDGQGSGSGWWSGGREDQETEPGTITSQAWDLETMQLNGTQLTISGGFNYMTGVTAGGKTYRRGDILIDLNGDANTLFTGTADQKLQNSYYNYDFAIHFSTADNDMSYTIVDLNGNSVYTSVTDVQKSNPWRLDDSKLTGTYIDGMSDSHTAGVVTTSDAQGTHYAMTVDLANYQPLLDAIAAASEMLVKYTVESGNDTIFGEAPLFSPASSVADTGSTLALLGAAFGGFAFMSRRISRNSRNSMAS